MDQVAVLTIAVPSALAGIGAVAYLLVGLSPVIEKLENRAADARNKLQLAAVESLKSLRVILDNVFEAYDAGEDRYATRARPEIALDAIREYNKLAVLQTRLDTAADRFRTRTSNSFWIALVFAIAMLAAIVLAVTIKDLQPAVHALQAGGLTLIVAAVAFVRAVIPYRRVDRAEATVAAHVRRHPAVAAALRAMEDGVDSL